MNGLDKLVNRIADESREEIDAVLAEAAGTAGDIRADGEKKAAAECAAIEKKSASQIEVINQRAKASADLRRKQIMLAGRQELISETIEMVRKRLCALPDGEYADIIDALLKKHVPSSDVVLKFNDADLKRLPKSIIDDFARASKKNGANVTVSGVSTGISNGFILDFGGIEENCTFDALIDQSTEKLQDAIKAILFA